MFDSLAQAYHWSHTDIMRLTIPQVIMYNHAAWVNRENYERRHDHEKGKPEASAEEKRVSKLEGEALFSYLRDWGDFS